MKRILSSLMVTAILVSVLAGCSGGGSSSSSNSTSSAGGSSGSSSATVGASPADGVKIRVAWWGNQIRNDGTVKVLDQFKAANAGLDYEAEFADWSGYWDKLATQSAAKSLPDVVQQDYQYLQQYVEKGLHENLEPYIEAGVLDLKDCEESTLVGGRIDGDLYGVNLGSNSLSLLYDKALVEQTGKTINHRLTWDEFNEVALAVKEKTGVLTNYMGPTERFVETSLRNDGLPKWSEDQKDFGSTDIKYIKRALEPYATGLANGAALPADIFVGRTGIEQDVLTDGKSWNSFANSNQVIAFMGAAGRDLGMAQYPEFADAKQPGAYIKPSQFFSIAKDSSQANKDWAVKFVSFMTNDVEANKALMAERGVPISKKVQEALSTIVDPATKMMFDFVATAALPENSSPIDPPDPAGAGEQIRIGQDIREAIMYGTMDLDTATQEYHDQVIAALNK